MIFALNAPVFLVTLALFVIYASAQTWSSCNPILSSDCPPNPALGRIAAIDFTSGPSDEFKSQGNASYDSNGASLTIAGSGETPQFDSKWYIMYGKVEIVMKAANGAGIVSSFVLQSDTLDEIDWEWLGAAPDEVQTNYFGKGLTETYDRGSFHAALGSQSEFKTYTIEWTAEQIVWQIDGVTVRVLRPEEASGQYPQTPMQVKVGAWSGGDPANAPGTIEWARGPTDYSKGPFTMHVKSITVSDYSRGSEYLYGDQSGTWQSIIAVDGAVGTDGSGVVDNPPSPTTTSARGQPTLVRIPTVPRPHGTPLVHNTTAIATATGTGTPNTYPGHTSPITAPSAIYTPGSAAVVNTPGPILFGMAVSIAFGFSLVWHI